MGAELWGASSRGEKAQYVLMQPPLNPFRLASQMGFRAFASAGPASAQCVEPVPSLAFLRRRRRWRPHWKCRHSARGCCCLPSVVSWQWLHLGFSFDAGTQARTTVVLSLSCVNMPQGNDTQLLLMLLSLAASTDSFHCCPG